MSALSRLDTGFMFDQSRGITERRATKSITTDVVSFLKICRRSESKIFIVQCVSKKKIVDSKSIASKGSKCCDDHDILHLRFQADM